MSLYIQSLTAPEEIIWTNSPNIGSDYATNAPNILPNYSLQERARLGVFTGLLNQPISKEYLPLKVRIMIYDEQGNSRKTLDMIREEKDVVGKRFDFTLTFPENLSNRTIFVQAVLLTPDGKIFSPNQSILQECTQKVFLKGFSQITHLYWSSLEAIYDMKAKENELTNIGYKDELYLHVKAKGMYCQEIEIRLTNEANGFIISQKPFILEGNKLVRDMAEVLSDLKRNSATPDEVQIRASIQTPNALATSLSIKKEKPPQPKNPNNGTVIAQVKDNAEEKKKDEKKGKCPICNRTYEECEGRFKQFAPIILDHEGGYKNEPESDPGDPTNRGITWPTWKQYAKIDLGVEPTLDNLKKITGEQATIIYYKRYWKPRRFCKVNNSKIALMIYDWTITSGGAVREVQKLLVNEFNQKIAIDGGFGDKTIGAINSIEDQDKLLNKIAEVRKQYYTDLTIPKPTDTEKLKTKKINQKKYLKGWLNRVDDCLKY